MPDTTRPRLVLRADLKARHVERLRRDFPAADFPLATAPDALQREIGEADALIGGGALSDELLGAAPRLRWIAATSAGVENLLTPALRARRDITLTNFRGVAAPNIAEHVLAMMFAFARGLPSLFALQREHRWASDAAVPEPFELDGQTLLIVGLGEIGRALAPKAAALGVRVLATERHPHDQPPSVEQLLPQERLNELLPQAGHVALCLPLTPQTQGVIGRAELELMPRGAYLYNVGRGGLLDHDALIEALQNGHLAGAGLDVTEPEPPPAASPLWTLPNVLLTGHTAGQTPHYWDRGMDLIADNVRRFLAGEPLRDVVNVEAGY